MNMKPGKTYTLRTATASFSFACKSVEGERWTGTLTQTLEDVSIVSTDGDPAHGYIECARVSSSARFVQSVEEAPSSDAADEQAPTVTLHGNLYGGLKLPPGIRLECAPGSAVHGLAIAANSRELEDIAFVLDAVLRRYGAVWAERITRFIPRRLEAAALPMDVGAASLEAYRSECERVDKKR